MSKTEYTLNALNLPIFLRIIKYGVKAAEKLLLQTVIYETTTGFPFVYPRDLYQNTIRFIEKRHKKPMLEVVKSVQDISEFTTLGHYLLTYMPTMGR